MRVKVDGKLAPGVSSKDIILYVIGKIGTAGGTGAVIEYCGSAIEGLSMEGRMSIVRRPSLPETLFQGFRHMLGSFNAPQLIMLLTKADMRA